ncbi:MAG: hypothetical protein WBF42_11775 [Terracidiphilus sp.]
MIVFLIILVNASVTAEGISSNPSEQVHFSAEEPGVKKPAVIPDDVLAALRRDKLVRNVLKSENIPEQKLPSTWFSASAIHLGGTKKMDLIVVGEPPIAGGNTVPFWVFRATPRGYELALTAPAHDLIVRNTRFNKYREIEMMGETGVEFSSVSYRFDGERYIAYRERSGDIH